MDLSRFLLAGVLCAGLAGCPNDEPTDPANPNTPNTPKEPATPGAGTPLQGTMYWTEDGDGEIHRLDLATGTDTALGTGTGADVAPDGKLVFVNLDLSEASPDALGASTPIVKTNFDGAEAADDNFANPRVSKDGTKVAYSSLSRNAFVVNRADGTVLARFEATAAERYDRPSWTPDGRVVLVGGYGNPGLFVSDATLTNLTRFDPDLELNVAYPATPSLSPDGTTVAFRVEKVIQTLRIDGTGLTTLTDEDEAREPTWSPDGAYIAYASYGHIKIRRATGGAPVDVLESYPALKEKLLTFGGLSHQIAWVR